MDFPSIAMAFDSGGMSASKLGSPEMRLPAVSARASSFGGVGGGGMSMGKVATALESVQLET